MEVIGVEMEDLAEEVMEMVVEEMDINLVVVDLAQKFMMEIEVVHQCVAMVVLGVAVAAHLVDTDIGFMLVEEVNMVVEEVEQLCMLDLDQVVVKLQKVGLEENMVVEEAEDVSSIEVVVILELVVLAEYMAVEEQMVQ